MKPILLALCLSLVLFACINKNFDLPSPFQKMNHDTALLMINHYSDSLVSKNLNDIIKRINFKAEQLRALNVDSIKLFMAADLVTNIPTVIMQTVTRNVNRNNALTYDYYSTGPGSLCPPPADCISSVELSH